MSLQKKERTNEHPQNNRWNQKNIANLKYRIKIFTRLPKDELTVLQTAVTFSRTIALGLFLRIISSLIYISDLENTSTKRIPIYESSKFLF